MLERIRKIRKNSDGFTLIELLMVIVILGVLAGVVVFAVNGINDKGQAAACQAEYKTIQVAQQAYYAKTTPSAYAADVPALKAAGLLADTNTTYWNTDNSGAPVAKGALPAGCP